MRGQAVEKLQVGIDLVEVAAVDAALRSPTANRYLARVYTRSEIQDCTTNGQVDPRRLAARFAAKEAAMKALRVGDHAIPWHAIEVVREVDGAPSLRLRGGASELARTAGLTAFSVSLSHELEYASAIVVAR
jgi:holo-[acyl-carrier protein] synthase